MFNLNDCVRLNRDFKDLALSKNDIGAIVDIQDDGNSYCVEFIDKNGETNEEALNHYFKKEELSKL